ncbi:ranBP2-like and GRIP domain-containing protein 3 isoform X4 [Symsagittifera roscoffensis]|uniref:ranBP2-like and GRIP domain-containing protein 3 isoform X4 n=1 Tax=Symsagittifera roscoffensis TaxID=84072 RepID=UPI00307BE0DD
MKTKESIDKHAKLVLSQSGAKDGKHSYNLARLYFEAHCYDDAKSHVNAFLQSIGNSDWRAHKLLADIELAEGCEQDALHTYKDVLRLHPDCKDALLKVAFLTAKFNPVEQAEKWMKEIEKRYPCEGKLSDIRDLVNSRKSGNHLTLLKQKAVQCGNDVEAQCQLLNELVNSGQTRQAFEHVVEKFGLFNRSLQWQRICEVVLENFMATSPNSEREKIGNFMILVTYYRQILLTAATAPLNSTKLLIQKFDRGLFRFVSGYGVNKLDDSSELACCAKEMSACLLTAVALIINKILLQKTFSLASVDMLLVSLCKTGLSLQPHKLSLYWVPNSFSFNSEGTSVSSSAHFDLKPRTIWSALGCERMTFLSHIWNAVKTERKLDSSTMSSCKLGAVRDQLLNTVYSANSQTSSSFLASFLHLLEPFYPNLNEIDHTYNLTSNDLYVKEFFKQTCESVEGVSWILLSRSGFPGQRNLGSESLKWMMSDKLPLSVELNANRVSNLDLQAFALATSFWVGEHVKYYNKLSPFLPSLPLLCSVATQEQSHFWRSLLGVEGRSSGEKSTSVASGGGTPNKGRNVIQSLQLIRGVVPGMPTAVLVSLAKSFQKLSEISEDSAWSDIYRQRSVHYWEKVLPTIKNITRGQSNIMDVEQERNNKLFPVSVLPTLREQDAAKLCDEGSLFVAAWYRSQGDLDASLTCLRRADSSLQRSPQSAIMKAEVLHDKSMNDNLEDRDSQRELLNTSMGEISSILKRRDLPVSVKKEAQKQLNNVANRLTELDRLDELDHQNAATTASWYGDGSFGGRGTKNSEISAKLDSVSGELSELNTNIQAMTGELRTLHYNWNDSMREMNLAMKKLVELQINSQMNRPSNSSQVMVPPSQHPILVPPQNSMLANQMQMMPGQNIPANVMFPPPHMSQFLPPGAADVPPAPSGMQFRSPVAPGSSIGTHSIPSMGMVPPAQFPSSGSTIGPSMMQRVIRQPIVSEKQSSLVSETEGHGSNPILAALLKPPSSQVELKLSQQFQPPKLTSTVEHTQDSIPAGSKGIANAGSRLGTPPNILTSTPKLASGKIVGQSNLGTSTNPLTVVGSSLNPADNSEGAGSSKKSLFSSLPSNKPDTVNTTSAPQFSSLFAPKPTQAGSAATGATPPFSFNPQVKSTAAPSSNSTFSFKMSAPVVSFATPASVFSPSTASSSGQSAAPLFTGFRGFQPVNHMAFQDQSKPSLGTSAFGNALSTSPSKAANDAVKNIIGSTTKPEDKNENGVKPGVQSVPGTSQFSFKFNLPAAGNADSSIPGKLSATPEKKQPEIVPNNSPAVVPAASVPKNVVASPGANKEGDDSIHDPQFEPIVHLDKVEIKTGEETEKAVFEERAKLLRFVEGEWKERGTGEMKILKTCSEKGAALKYRIVMRRDQIKKLCANHVITDEMSIKVHPSNNKSLVWIANDFSEEEEKLEQLCVRFKTPEIAQKFKTVFDEGVEVYKQRNGACSTVETKVPKSAENKNVDKTTDEVEKPKEISENVETKEPQKDLMQEEKNKEIVVENIGPIDTEPANSFAAKFGLQPGQWNCDACLLKNNADADKCIACETPKDGKTAPGGGGGTGSDLFGASKGPVFKFDTTKSNSSGAFKFGAASTGQTSSFKFGVTPSATNADPKPSENDPPKDDKDKQTGLFEGFAGFGVQSNSNNNSAPVFGVSAFQPTFSTNQNTEPQSSAVTTTASLFSTTESSKPTLGSSSVFGKTSGATSSLFGSGAAGASSSIFGKSASSSQPATGMVFGKGAGPMGAAGSVFDRPKNEELQTADGKRSETEEMNGGETQLVSCCPEITDMLNTLTKEESEKCGVTFEEECEDEDERYYYREGEEGEYLDEEDEYCYGEDYEEPYEGEEEGGENLDPCTDLDTIITTPRHRLGAAISAAQYISPMARFDPNQSAGTPPQVSSVFGAKPKEPPASSSNATNETANTETEENEKDLGENEGDEIEVVFSRSEDPNDENKELVEKFKLPPLFYDSLNKPDCSGCVGCGDDPATTNMRIYKDSDKVTSEESEKVAENVKTSGDDEEGVKSLDANKTSGFLFGNQVSSDFSFASLASSATAQSGAFGATQPGKSSSFTPKPLFAGLSLGGATSSAGGEGDSNPGEESGNVENEENDIHFKPIVQLSKVETTGSDENDNETVFSARAKLFRFQNGEWKERGVGELKVQRYIPKNVGRVIMRRDAILKLCANHSIFPDMALAPMPNSSGKAFVWSATDFSDDTEGSIEKLCVRFKNAELGSQFEESFNKMRELTQTE